MTKERLWANRSRFFFKKEQHQCFAWDSREFALKKQRFAWKKCIFYMFLTLFPPFYAQEWVAPTALYSVFFKRAMGAIPSRRSLKRVTMNESLPLLLTKKQPWAIRSFSWANRSESFAHKKECFAWKTDERIPNPTLWSAITPCTFRD